MHDESHVDVSVNGVCKWVTYALFDMQISNLDTGSYLRLTDANTLATADKEKSTITCSPVCSVNFLSLQWCTSQITFPERRPKQHINLYPRCLVIS